LRHLTRMGTDTDDRSKKLAETRASWNVATRAHNAHKRDQAAWLKQRDATTLFPEELELLGPLSGVHLLHTLCNSGQDTLSLAKHGAVVTGVDMSDEAIAFARALARDTAIPATFIESEMLAYFDSAPANAFDVCFGSYGCLTWIDDIARFFRGCARVLKPGGRVVYLEFHPLAWSLHGDPYKAPGHDFASPVNDYVGASMGALSPSGHIDALDGGEYVNPHNAHSAQHTIEDLVNAIIDAGFTLTRLREWDYSNGCSLHPNMKLIDGNRWVHEPSWPLMLGLAARR